MADSITKKIDRKIGANLHTIRTELGMSREHLGAAMQEPVTQQAVHKWETGESRISSSSLVEIANICDCHVSDLLEGVDAVLAGAEVPTKVRDRDGGRALMRDYHAINDPALQAIIRNMAHALVIELASNWRRIDRE